MGRSTSTARDSNRRRRAGWGSVVVLLAVTLLGGQSAQAATPHQNAAAPEGTLLTPTGVLGPLLTGASAIGRARAWITARPAVPYNQQHRFASPTNFYGDGAGHDPTIGWREDCSGFVSYAWNLPGPGYITSTMPSITRPISWAALQPGDALLIPGEHTALFAGWDNSSHTTYTLWQEANTIDGTVVSSGISLSDSYWSRFTPVRYDGIEASATDGDYNGDGKADPALWRPSTGQWYIHAASGPVYGRSGDIPVPADYNGDGTADPALWRPSTGQWYIYGAAAFAYGRPGDIPVAADYNGDGKADPAIWRPSTGQWYIYGIAGPITYGRPGDIPVPADYNGNGKAELALWRPSTGQWYRYGVAALPYGRSGDVPVPADYNGDGAADQAVWRPSTGQWYVYGATTSTVYGRSGDVVEPADYNGDGAADPAVWRPSTGQWYFDGAAPDILYGRAGDVALP